MTTIMLVMTKMMKMTNHNEYFKDVTKGCNNECVQ